MVQFKDLGPKQKLKLLFFPGTTLSKEVPAETDEAGQIFVPLGHGLLTASVPASIPEEIGCWFSFRQSVRVDEMKSGRYRHDGMDAWAEVVQLASGAFEVNLFSSQDPAVPREKKLGDMKTLWEGLMWVGGKSEPASATSTRFSLRGLDWLKVARIPAAVLAGCLFIWLVVHFGFGSEPNLVVDFSKPGGGYYASEVTATPGEAFRVLVIFNGAWNAKILNAHIDVANRADVNDPKFTWRAHSERVSPKPGEHNLVVSIPMPPERNLDRFLHIVVEDGKRVEKRVVRVVMGDSPKEGW
jgi:hypothetical protein